MYICRGVNLTLRNQQRNVLSTYRVSVVTIGTDHPEGALLLLCFICELLDSFIC